MNFTCVRKFVLLWLLFASSCETPNLARWEVPAEVSFNRAAGRDDWLYLTLHLATRQELLLTVDTGSPITVLDKSLEPQLGTRIGVRPMHYAWKSVTGGIYAAPKLYLDNTQLQTGSEVWTDDFSGRIVPGRQVMGILGMDCLRHYCIQLDFSASKARFLDPEQVDTEGLGRPFRLTVYPSGPSGYVTVHESFAGARRLHPILDTGCLLDGVLEPKGFEWQLRNTVARTNQLNDATGFKRYTALVRSAVFGGETYTNLWFDRAPAMHSEGKTNYLNAVGLPFLARHLVTLNFPKKMMYLKRTSGK